ncbi:branched-chain amino acid ABC transporter substrate-binding protein [Streptomyces sp. URMC 125]|uniref:branched-chain amino acid ABC transporter substrate-binding protein n=1 Tax=Streptomyces sp. URMC 125 TaxID=3423419 RepID=UPI003F1B16B6
MAGRRISLLTVKRSVTAAVVLAVLAGATLVFLDWWVERQARCADGVVKRGADEECVGVTDGSYVFADHLAPVTKRIREANEAVVEEGDDYVSVAYMTSFTVQEDDSNSEESVRHELQGAYLAQQRYNERSTPKIRLLIANTGSDSEHWRHTVGELVARKGDDGERLVAVAGLGPSTDRNREALRELSAHGLAMVASTMTATDVNEDEDGGKLRGYVRVAPTNVDEAKVAAEYLHQEGFGTAMVVQDVAERNLYARTLGDAFTDAFREGGRRRLVAERKTFDSSVPGNWKSELHFLSNQLCFHRPEVVYFAGRGQHLTHFLEALSDRVCPEWDFTVMTGDDTTNLTAQQVRKATASGIRVYYTGLAHPEMWKDEPEGAPEGLQAAFREDGQLEQWFGDDSHADGQAMMSHDAVLTAARGVQMADIGETGVTSEAVGRMFHLMQDSERVRGASGSLSFESDGNAHDKTVPILRLDPNGIPVFVRVLSPEG